MKTSRFTLPAIVVSLACVAQAPQTRAQQGDSNEERAIRAIVDKINVAYNVDDADKGVEIMRGVLSDKAYALITPNPQRPSEAVVIDKKVYCELLPQWLRNGPSGIVHTVRQVTIVGPIAYEKGVSKIPETNGKVRTGAWLNVFAKESVGWRLVLSTPVDGVEMSLRPLPSTSAK